MGCDTGDGWCVDCGDVFHLDDLGGYNPPCQRCGLCRSCCECDRVDEDDFGPDDGLDDEEREAIEAIEKLRAAVTPICCRSCNGSGMEGWGEDADRCSCCDGMGALPLLGWKSGPSLRRRRELAASLGPIGEF